MAHVSSESSFTIVDYCVLYTVIKCDLFLILITFLSLLVLCRVLFILMVNNEPHSFLKVVMYILFLVLLLQNPSKLNDWLVQEFVEYYITHFMTKIDPYLWDTIFRGSLWDDIVNLLRLIYRWVTDCFLPDRPTSENLLRIVDDSTSSQQPTTKKLLRIGKKYYLIQRPSARISNLNEHAL